MAFSAGLVWLLGTGWVSPSVRATTQANPFADHTASQLLDQIAAGLVSHNPNRVLGAFDLNKMADGPLFKQQITSFFSRTGAIRVHFNTVRTSMDGARGLATAEVEMEADQSDDRLPPLHKQAQLRLVAENADGRWKFTDVQPRTFFSTQP